MAGSGRFCVKNDVLIISIKEARKLLGKDGKHLSDEEVENLIIGFSAIVKRYLKSLPKY